MRGRGKVRCGAKIPRCIRLENMERWDFLPQPCSSKQNLYKSMYNRIIRKELRNMPYCHPTCMLHEWLVSHALDKFLPIRCNWCTHLCAFRLLVLAKTQFMCFLWSSLKSILDKAECQTFPHPLQSPNPSVAHTLQPQVEVERSRSGRRSSRSGERAMLVPHCLRSGCRQWIVLATNINTLHNLYVDIRGCEVLHPGGYRSAKLLNTADEILREEVAVWGRNPCEELKIAQLERKGLEARELENVVIDPTRTVSSGKMEIGAFMAYSKDYKTPDDKCSYQTISLRKSEKFGIPWKQVPPAEKSYLLGHRRAFSFQKPLQSVLSRRSFSTETDGDDGFNAQISDADLIDTKGFEGVVFGDSGLWMQNVEIKANNFNRELAVDSLKAEFERDFRPLLAFHCLMLPHSVDHYTTAYCHGPVHGSTNLRTLYLSSLDVMVRMRTLKKWQRKFLLDHIIQRRILIVDDWEHSYANIEMLEYDFGTKLGRGSVQIIGQKTCTVVETRL